MALTTSRLGLSKPETTDPATQLRESANDNADYLGANAAIYLHGTLAARPTSSGGTPGIEGRIYRATNGQMFYDTGTGWVEVAVTAAGTYKTVAYAVVSGSEEAGWLLCDGRAVSRTTYAALFTAIGTTYNTGGEAGTDFRLPDRRGRVGVGVGTNAEVDALTDNDGVAVASRKLKHRHGKGTLNITASGNHVHSIQGEQFSATPGGPTIRMEALAVDASFVNTADATHTHASASFAGEVGDTAGPLDGPAYQTEHVLIKT